MKPREPESLRRQRRRGERSAGEAMRELAATGAKDVCVQDPGGTERRIPAGRLKPGDMFVVRPGETIATDGEASEHAVAAAITTAAREGAGPLPQAGDFTALPGLGARGIVDGHEIIAGRERLFRDRGIALSPRPGSRPAARAC